MRAYDKMDKTEFKEKLFDVFVKNSLPIQDIAIHDTEDTMTVHSSDGTLFKIKCENCGN